MCICVLYGNKKYSIEYILLIKLIRKMYINKLQIIQESVSPFDSSSLF